MVIERGIKVKGYDEIKTNLEKKFSRNNRVSKKVRGLILDSVADIAGRVVPYGSKWERMEKISKIITDNDNLGIRLYPCDIFAMIFCKEDHGSIVGNWGERNAI